ncbi:hypothetical protein FACS189437_05090 [Bacteroidia bacterium]|nr:hypothetical protein FACS189437_05090 [Bacteroidia bacterium]
MNKFKIFLVFFMPVAMLSVIHAQNFEKSANGIVMNIQGINVEVQFFTPSTVRIMKSPQGWNYTKKSLSVIAEPQTVNFTARKSGNSIKLESAGLHVEIDQHSGVISFFTNNGKKLLLEKSAPVFTDFNDAGVKTFSVYQPFKLDAGEAIYGLGQLQNGQMSQRGITKRLVQGNTEDAVTFFQSVKGYGLFWDNYSPTTFTDNAQETSFKSEVGDLVDYYFMYGGNADGVVAQMRSLTGDAPMFPLWAYGFFQSKERYKSQDEIVGIVRKYRESNVPSGSA